MVSGRRVEPMRTRRSDRAPALENIGVCSGELEWGIAPAIPSEAARAAVRYRRPMRATSVLLLAMAIVACAVGSAAASASRVVSLPQGATLLIAGSNVTCGSGHQNGETFIDCGIVGVRGQPKVGSYVTLMADDGKVGVATATTHRIVFNRAPAELRGETATITAHVGDSIVLPGVPSISCIVRRVSGQANIFCYFVDAHGAVRPGSYSFGLSDVVTTTLAWTSATHWRLVGHWPENG
jgi:hypothetical protein